MIPVPNAKILGRHHFLPLFVYAFHGRTGSSTAKRLGSLGNLIDGGCPVSLTGDVLEKSCHVLVQVRKLYLFGAGTAS